MKLERSAIVNSLILVLALASALVLFLTRERATTSERSARANNLFVEFSRERLVRISLRQGNERFSLERDRSPDAGPRAFTLDGHGNGDPEAVESLLRSLELAAYLKRFDAAESERHAFGLDAPRAELELDFGDSAAVLRIGKVATSPHDATYVEVESRSERAVGLVRTGALSELLVSRDELRPNALVPSTTELSAIRFRGPKLAGEVRRGAGASWLDSTGRRARRDTVDNLLLELTSVKIERFVEPALASAALDRDSLELLLTPRSEAGAQPPSISLRVGARCPADPKLLLAERKGPNAVAGCVAGGLRGLVEHAALDLADPFAFALHTDEVEALRIERNGEKLELIRNERGFLLLSPARADVALDAGNRRLDAILKATGQRVESPNLAALGLEPAQGTVSARSSAIAGHTRVDEVLELGRLDAQGRLPVRRSEDGVVLLLPRDTARAFSVDSTLLRPTKLLDFGPSAVKQLEVTWHHEHELLRRRENGELELVTPANVAHDGALALDLLQTLGTLSALRWVADSDDGSFGLSLPTAQARLTLTSPGAPDRLLNLRVGSKTPGGAFATLDSEPGVFIVEHSVVETLTTLLLTRGAFARDPETLARIELERGGRRVALTLEGDKFAAQPALPEPSVAAILETIASLRAEAAVHTGHARSEEGFQAPTLSVRLLPRSGKQAPTAFRVGARDSYRDAAIFYARVDGIDASFALPQGAVKRLIDAF